jgi:hypothetical protein
MLHHRHGASGIGCAVDQEAPTGLRRKALLTDWSTSRSRPAPFDQLTDKYFNNTRRVVGQWRCRGHLPALPMRQRGTMIGNGRQSP